MDDTNLTSQRNQRLKNSKFQDAQIKKFQIYISRIFKDVHYTPLQTKM